LKHINRKVTRNHLNSAGVVIKMVRKICDYAGAVAYEIGENFYGKVQLRKDKYTYNSDKWSKEISGPSFKFLTKAEAKQFIKNLMTAIKMWDKL